MRQVCNLVYHTLSEGRTAPQIAELEASLADPREREMKIGQQNEEAMKALQAMGGFIPPPPGARPRRREGGQ